MLKEFIRRKLVDWLDNPHPKTMLAKSLVAARGSLDYLRRPILDPSYDFRKDRSLYPTFAAQFAKIMDTIDTHPQYAWGSLQGLASRARSAWTGCHCSSSV